MPQSQRLILGRGREELGSRPCGREGRSTAEGLQQPGGRLLGRVIDLQTEVRALDKSVALYPVQRSRDVELGCVSFASSQGRRAAGEGNTMGTPAPGFRPRVTMSGAHARSLAPVTAACKRPDQDDCHF